MAGIKNYEVDDDDDDSPYFSLETFYTGNMRNFFYSSTMEYADAITTGTMHSSMHWLQ